MKSFKEFFFSPMGILLIPALIIFFILLSNLDTIMDRMGFETRAYLKSELTKTKYTMNLLQKDLLGLKIQQKKFVNQCLIKEEIVTDYVREAENIDNYIKEIVSKNILGTPLIRTEVIEVGEDNVNVEVIETRPLPPINNDNIVAINKVFNEFFGG